MRWKWFRKRRSLLKAFFVATEARDRKITSLEAQIARERESLRDEFIICHAAAYPDPLNVYPPTLENARESARLLRPDPDFGRVVIRHRVVSEWKEVRR